MAKTVWRDFESLGGRHQVTMYDNFKAKKRVCVVEPEVVTVGPIDAVIRQLERILDELGPSAEIKNAYYGECEIHWTEPIPEDAMRKHRAQANAAKMRRKKKQLIDKIAEYASLEKKFAAADEHELAEGLVRLREEAQQELDDLEGRM